MKRIRTTEDFVDSISKEHLWRMREISQLNLLIANSQKDPSKQRLLIRCAIPILYAHWEGFIKHSASCFLELVIALKYKFGEIVLALQATGQLRQFKASLSTLQIDKYHSSLALFTKDKNDYFRCNTESTIDTADNLDSAILKRIICSLGLDYGFFATKEKLLDGILLYYRNNIAHGKDWVLQYDEFTSLHDAVLEMINQFRNQIENTAVQKSYLRNSANVQK